MEGSPVWEPMTKHIDSKGSLEGGSLCKQYLHVSSLSLSDGFIKLVARSHLAGQALVHASQLVSQEADVILQLALLIFLLLDLLVQLFSLDAEVFDTCGQRRTGAN